LLQFFLTLNTVTALVIECASWPAPFAGRVFPLLTPGSPMHVEAISLPSPHTLRAPLPRAVAETWLETLRWQNRRPVCPHCGARHAYRMACVRTGGVRFKCARCRKPFSARRGTVMERSNVQTGAWLWAMTLYLSGPSRGLPARIQRDCGVSYKTAWSMVRRMNNSTDDPVLRALRQAQGPLPTPEIERMVP